MPVSADYRAWIEERLGALEHVSSKRMFGGLGVFYRGLMFGLVADDVFYLKVSDATRGDFEAAGQGPFIYETKNGQRGVMSYYRVPDEVLEDDDEIAAWARRAIDVALVADAARPKGRRKARQGPA